MATAEPTLDFLRRDAQSKAATYGQKPTPENASNAMAAVVAFRAIKYIDAASVSLTQKEADYICSVIASRVAAEDA